MGYPYQYESTGLLDLPGPAGLALISLGVLLAAAGLALRLARGQLPLRLSAIEPGVLLVVVLALSTPVGTVLASAIGTNVFGVRNLAGSWPGFALALAALLVAAGPRLRVVAVALTLAGFVIGAWKLLEDSFARPDYAGAAELVDRDAGPRDPVIDAAVVTPGPLSGLDVVLDRPHRVFRVGAPQERDHPFTVLDRARPTSEVAREAAAAAAGGPIFLVAGATPAERRPAATDLAREVEAALPSGYRLARTHDLPGILDVGVLVYERGAAPNR